MAAFAGLKPGRDRPRGRSLLALLALLSLPIQAQPLFIEASIGFRHRSSPTSQKYLPETMSGGVALLDYDGDGRIDIYFVNGAKLEDPMPRGASPDKSDPAYWNRLYRNRADGTFEDVTERAGVAGRGYGQGAAAGDYDGDGRVDLYVTNYGANILYRNLGGGRFEDVTKRAGVAGSGWSASASFFDYDSDGDLDLFVSRYLDWSFETDKWCGDEARKERAYCHPRYFEPLPHLLYRNEGNGTFRDVSATSHLAAAPGKGLGVALTDVDQDGRLDVFVANDKVPQQLFVNTKRGFEESALLLGAAYDGDGETYSGMGVAAGDYDGDGRADLFVNALALQGYTLYRNAGGFFEDVSTQTRVAAITERHSGWGAGFLDYDNDGRLDLFVAQGHVMDNIETTQPGVRYREPFLLMRNTGAGFEDVSSDAGSAFQQAHAARGAAFGDLDNDGDLDIVVNNNNEPATILVNQSPAASWLTVDLGQSIGATVTVTYEGGRQSALVSGAGSYMSSNDPRAHFGLGAAKAASVEIRWPGGRVQKLEGVEAGQILSVEEPR